MRADLEFQKERADRARLVRRDAKPVAWYEPWFEDLGKPGFEHLRGVEDKMVFEPEDGTGDEPGAEPEKSHWSRWLDEPGPSGVKPWFLEEIGPSASAWRAVMSALEERLAEVQDGDGAWWAFWGCALIGEERVAVGAQPLGAFVEDRVVAIGLLGERSTLREVGVQVKAPGERELGWLIARRDERHRPIWTVSRRSFVALTIPRDVTEKEESPLIRYAFLDRVDGRELVVSWNMARTTEWAPGALVLVITREPAEALRRLRKSGVRWDHFHRVLDGLERSLVEAPDRTWTLAAFEAAHGHWPTERQAALRRLLSPRVPRPPLREEPGEPPVDPRVRRSSAGRSAQSVRRATLARILALYPAIPVRHGPLMLFKTFVFDTAFPEPSFGYDLCDYDRGYLDDYGPGCLWEAGGVVFEAPVGDLVEEGQRAYQRFGERLESHLYGKGKVRTWDPFSEYRRQLLEKVDDEVFEVRHTRLRTMAHPGQRGVVGSGDDLSIVCREYPEELWYRLYSDVRDRLAYESRLEYLPDLNREQIYLNFVMSTACEPRFDLRWAVLQIRVPLHLAWQGVSLGAPFGLRSANLGVLAAEDGVRWFQDPPPGAPLRPRRLGLGDRIPLSGVGAGVPDLRLEPGALFLPAYEARCWPPPEPIALRLGRVTELVVTGAPDAAALVALLAPEAASEP